ncbi:MAG: phage portal protein [Acidobacteriota bacterium]
MVSRPLNLAYEGAAQTRRTARWIAPASSPNTGMLGSLALLRDRSRQAVRNDGFAEGAIDAMVSNLIGTGIKPLSKSPDATFRKAVHAAWLRWTDESDADGGFDWYGQQSQATRGFLEAGEIFVRLRPRLPSDGLSVPLQVQVIEPELCPHTHSTMTLPNGNKVRAGIEFNVIGKRVAYWFHPSRPGDWEDFDSSTLQRVPAELVIHLYNPLRVGQLRGLPLLTQALIKMHEIDKLDDAMVLRHQVANMFAGFLTREPSTVDPEIDPLSSGTLQTTLQDQALVSLEPGLMQELGPGESVTFSNPPDIGAMYPDFMRQQLRAVAAATKVPYELLTGDMSSVNDRTVRVILNAFRRRLRAWQEQIITFQLCRRVWATWLDRAFLSGALPTPAGYATNPWPWVHAEFKPERFEYIHPVQDIEAKVAEINAGFTTRSAVVSEQGDDAEAIDAEQAEDNARADELGLKYDSDARFLKVAKSALAPAHDTAAADASGSEGAAA